MSCDIFLVAGEASGDLLGAQLAERLKKLSPDLRLAGVAGPRMRAVGVTPLFQMEELNVMGFSDVLASLPRLLSSFFRIRRTILKLEPRAVVFIDYPGMNLKLAGALWDKIPSKLIQYVCPSVWAWKRHRIQIMEETLDLLLCLFPFEPALFNPEKLPARFVGHPLAVSQLTTQAEERPYIALFPGSRLREIERNLPILLEAAERVATPFNKIAISVAHSELEPLIHRLAAPWLVRHSSWELVPREQSAQLMARSHLALAKSGTITLELALHGVPTVVIYAISRFDQFLAQKVFNISLPHYCIVNLLLSERVFPELFGCYLTVDSLVAAATTLSQDQAARSHCLARCSQLAAQLKGDEASQLAAQEILTVAGIPALV